MSEDRELLTRWQGGDKAAGAELFDRHYQQVTRFFRNKTTSTPEDLVQRTFLGLVEALPGFRGEGSFRSFLYGVAYNVLRNHYRTLRRTPKIDFGVTSLMALQPRLSGVIAERAERRALVSALRRIGVEHQVLLELYYDEGLTAAEIAAALEVPVGTVRTRLRRAKQLVAEELQRGEQDRSLVDATLSLLPDPG